MKWKCAMCGATKNASSLVRRMNDFMKHWTRVHYNVESSTDIRTP